MAAQSRTTISTKELKDLLDTGADITILDVRNDDEFQRWVVEGRHRPSMVHIPYFVAVEEPDQFVKTVESQIPKEKLVVAVCAKGDSSAWIAEEFLRPRGYQVVNLEGGMLQWGQFYDFRLVPESAHDQVQVYQIQRTARGCLHYLVAYENDKVVVIDPPRHWEQVLDFVRQKGWTITHIFDTHGHADHISGGSALSKATGAPYFLHPYDAIHPIDVLPATIEYHYLQDGMSFRLGDATLTALHIPGHTLGNIAFLLNANGRYLFSGDSLFIVSIARPDLGGRGETWSGLWYDTLTTRLLTLPDDVLVLPGHFSQHAEARQDGLFAARLGDLKKTNEDIQRALSLDKEQFVSYLLSHLPVFPPEYVDIKRVNAGLLQPEPEKADELELGKNVCALASAYR
ncbi:MAG: MBL fold metallo-hydrolase [Armatimonadetes bacterium]|nr:MBL fold metallo-hydrolase [Armatimonadota bacterium]MDW8121259.1 MBL fold metallo-hydrolase [Armatimonadota bacterium]